MCDPVTALSAASAALGLVGQQQQAQVQDQYNKEATAAAVDAANQTYQATQARMGQEVAAASQDKINSSIAAAEARATAATAAGEAGIQGGSVSQLMASFYSKQGRYNDALDTNLQMSRQGLTDSMDQVHNQTTSTIHSLPQPQPLGAADFLGAATRVAGARLAVMSDAADNGKTIHFWSNH